MINGTRGERTTFSQVAILRPKPDSFIKKLLTTFVRKDIYYFLVAK